MPMANFQKATLADRDAGTDLHSTTVDRDTGTATIVDSDAGTDPDDTAVAILVARAPDHFGVKLMVSNDETTTFAKARFLAHALRLAGAAQLPVAAGLPSNKQRTTDLADSAGLVPNDIVVRTRPAVAPHDVGSLVPNAVAPGVDGDAVSRIVEVLEAHECVTYVGLGALSNLDAALTRRPELATRVRLFQMGPAVMRGFSRGRAQYNARIDPGAFRRVLERVPRPTLVATHTTWGAPAPAPPLGVYPDDDLARAITDAAFDMGSPVEPPDFHVTDATHVGPQRPHDAARVKRRPDLALYLRHLAAFVESGKDCSILHDPVTLLAACDPDIDGAIDLVDLDVVVDHAGWLHLTARAVALLRALPGERTAAIANALLAWEPPPAGTVIGVRMSLSADQVRLRSRIGALLVSER